MNYVCEIHDCTETGVIKKGATEPIGDVWCGSCQELMSETENEPTVIEVQSADPAN